MHKIIVIGCPGSGKSYFSRELHKITGLPLYHLDMMFWNSDKTTVDKDVFLGRLNRVLNQDQWIIDGNYGSTMDLRMKWCDGVFFLDYPTELCLNGVKERRGKPRCDMPWVETHEDEEFLQFIKDFQSESRPQIISLLNKYKDKRIFIFKSRKDADEYLETLKKSLQ